MPRLRIGWSTSRVGALCTLLCPAVALAAPTEPGSLANPLAEAASCQNCHSYPNAAVHAADPVYAPYFGWQGSMMANAARDPVFWAAVAIADQDHPGETVDCIRCHSPNAFLEGRGDATTIDALQPKDLDGVGCELCHRLVDDGETPAGNARYAIDDIAVGGAVPRRGPWDYDDGVPMPPHPAQHDPYTGSSRLCGTCHDVTTPRERVDERGQPMGILFNEQRTYSEWLGSEYAVPGPTFASCQDCHMPAVDDMPGCQSHVDQYAHPTGGRRHDLLGANRFMLELLRAEYGDAGTGEIVDFFWTNAIERMDEFLASAATLHVEGPSSVDLAEGLAPLTTTVTNETGHKLPTGYSEGRVMWLEVIATYRGEVVFSSGAWDQRSGTMQDDPLLRTYRAVAEDHTDGAVFHLLRNDRWVEDTRIPPKGLQPNVETDPVGDRYSLLDDGTWPNFDTYTYVFGGRPDVVDATPEDLDDDVLEVRVRLLYLINTAEYIRFLAEENRTNGAGDHVAMLFDTAGGATPVVLATQTLTIPIDGFGPGVGETSTTGESESTGATVTADGTADGGSTSSASATDTDGGAPMTGGDGCGCRTGSGRHAAAVLVGLVLFGRRRRGP